MAKNVLSPQDPTPVDLFNADGLSPFVLSCEHAGCSIPASLGNLGVAAQELARHIAYDIGAEGISRQLSQMLNAPLVLQRYSRLVVDCNRHFEALDCIPAVSDGTIVPANTELSERARRQRFAEIHQPFHHALAGLLDRRAAAKQPTVLVSIHSFTARLLGKPQRPWALGVLSNRDRSFACRFLAAFQAENTMIVSAHNEPYAVDDMSDYTIPVHGEHRGLPHLLIEIRNNLIADHAGQRRWAKLVAAALIAANAKGNIDGR